MGNEDVGKKHDDQISKQKETLAKAKSVVQRPEEVSKSSTAPPPDRDYAAPPKFVTYPEFEPVVNSKATFLSLQRLLLVVYLSSGMAATIYAISKLLLQPLLRRLIQARRDFYRHGLEKADALGAKLSECQVVEEGLSESLEAQAGNLLRIAEILKLQSTGGETAAHNELSFATEDLVVYLNNHIYTSAPFIGYGTAYGSGFGSNSEDSTKNDMVARVKAEIRSVKGAVLNMYPPDSYEGQTKGGH